MSKTKKNYPTIYKTKNISGFKIKSYSFKADLDQSLLLKHLKALGLSTQLDVCYKIEGEFSIDWDDDIAMPQIESLYIVNPLDDKVFIEIDLDRCFNHKCLLIDGYAIQDLIADGGDCGDWSADRQAAYADAAYDSWRDSQLEG